MPGERCNTRTTSNRPCKCPANRDLRQESAFDFKSCLERGHYTSAHRETRCQQHETRLDVVEFSESVIRTTRKGAELAMGNRILRDFFDCQLWFLRFSFEEKGLARGPKGRNEADSRAKNWGGSRENRDFWVPTMRWDERGLSLQSVDHYPASSDTRRCLLVLQA